MANKGVFATKKRVVAADTVNEAGGKAYKLGDKEALAQLAVTSCFNNTYYATGEENLEKVLELAAGLDPNFIAKAAVYARQTAHMKDTPAVLLAVLASRTDGMIYLEQVFDTVIDNAKMLCNFVQIIRSGVTGRKSFGTAVKRLIQNWLNARTPEQLFKDSIGQANPSLSDVIRMVHPNPPKVAHSKIYEYLIKGLEKNPSMAYLPQVVKDFENFKKGKTRSVPDVPFRALTALPLDTEQWTEIARNAPWNMCRMNLNTFQRHNVFDNVEMVGLIADKLRDAESVRRSRAFPYTLMTAYQNTEGVPRSIRESLQDAMEIATENVPVLGMDVAVCVDTSGSMRSPVTGFRVGGTSKVTCVDVAALVASCILRTNRHTEIVPFDTRAHQHDLNARDTVMTNASKLARYGGGGTDLASAMDHLLRSNSKADLIIFVSDNESWFNQGRGHQTRMAEKWVEYKRRRPQAKLVLIDIQPYTSTQVQTDKDVLNVGGWSDSVFEVIRRFASREKLSFASLIEEISI